MQDHSISIAEALEIPKACNKPSRHLYKDIHLLVIALKVQTMASNMPALLIWVLQIFRYITVTSYWAWWHLKSLAYRFTPPLIQVAIKEKHQSSAPLAHGRGIHGWPVNSPHKRPIMQKMFSFDDDIVYIIGFIILLIRVKRQHRWKQTEK